MLKKVKILENIIFFLDLVDPFLVTLTKLSKIRFSIISSGRPFSTSV